YGDWSSDVCSSDLTGPAVLRPTALHCREQQHREHDGEKDERHQTGDLPPAPRPLAGDLPRSTVDQDVEQLLPVAVIRHPDGQQQVLERDRLVARLLGLDALVVAADVAIDETDDLRVHDPLGLAEPLLEADAVAFGLEAAEEIGAERLEVPQVPGFEPGDEVRRHALRPAYE